MKHLEVRQQYSAARRIFNSLLGISSGDETLHLMFDILLNNWEIRHHSLVCYRGLADILWTFLGCLCKDVKKKDKKNKKPKTEDSSPGLAAKSEKTLGKTTSIFSKASRSSCWEKFTASFIASLAHLLRWNFSFIHLMTSKSLFVIYESRG